MNRTAAGFLSASVGVAVWSWFANGHINSNSSKSPNVPVAKSGETRSQSTEEPQIAPEKLVESEIWSRTLQTGFQTKPSSSVVEPLMSPVAPRPNVVDLNRTATPDVGLRLVGTVIEQGKSIAIAIDRAGKPGSRVLPRRKGARYFWSRTPHSHNQQHSAADPVVIDSVRRHIAVSSKRPVCSTAHVSGFEVGNKGGHSVP